MLTQAQIARAQQPRTTPYTLPAPVTGWNTRDPLDGMDQTDAVVMDNWEPQSDGVAVRDGSSTYATLNTSSSVQTVAEFYTGATRKALAAADGKIWDWSAGGSISSSLASGFTSDKWQTVNYKGLIFFQNGADTPQSYDGSVFGDAGWTGTGLTAANLNGAIVFKSRLYFWEKGAPWFWYGGIEGVTGTLTKFDLSSVVQTGGNILAITSMSHDGGSGLQDLICFIFTTGEFVIYDGTDPADSTTWSLVARYRMGAPLNMRAVARYGADAYVTTVEDHTSLSLQLAALRDGSFAPKSKAAGAARSEAAANGSLFGWQIQIYPKKHAVLVNVPHADGSFVQHVFKTDQQAWARWTGYASYCWGLFDDDLYFGSLAGKIVKVTGNTDNGDSIMADCQQAWTPLQASMSNQFNASYRKRLSAIRPVISSVGSIKYQFGIGYDYQPILALTPQSVTSNGSPWDSSPWNTSPWSPEVTIDTRWKIAAGMTGQNISLRLRAAAKQSIKWLRTDMRTETGSAL